MPSSRPSSRARRPAPAKRQDAARLILASGLTVEEVTRLLAPYGFQDFKGADANLQAIAGEPRERALLAPLMGDLLASLARTADPDQALTHWERFLAAGLNRTQLFTYLAGSPRILDLLCTIFGNSPALAQTLIRDPFLVYWLAEQDVLTVRPRRAALEAELRRALTNVAAMELKLERLRRFRRREMLRIGVRDLLRLAPVTETTQALSELASLLIQAALDCVETALQAVYGVPMHRGADGRLVKTGFAVIGMGKLGGGELNFSSDVDLIYVYTSDEGETRGRGQGRGIVSIPNEEYFEYVARDLTKALTQGTQEGHVFRVDLRLRAEGSVGRLARPLAGYARYYQSRGQVWEKLALLKAWPVAGDPALGQAFLRMVKPFIIGKPGTVMGREEAAAVVSQVKAVKDMIDDKMEERGHGRRNVKLGTGGIREIEFTVQTVQVLCGRRLPRILDRGTLASLAKFKRARLLPSATEAALRRAYIFLRDVEHKLQMVYDLQTHALPDSHEEMARCAVRLGYGKGKKGLTKFNADLTTHRRFVSQTFQSLFAPRGKSGLLKSVFSKRR